MQFLLAGLGLASSIATVIALVITLLYYLYQWPFNLKKLEHLTVRFEDNCVRLHWKLVKRASNYYIYRANAKSGVVDIYFCDKHFYTDATVVAGETYEYYVVAEDQGHQSPQSDKVPVKIPGAHRDSEGGNSVETVKRDDSDLPETQWPVECLRQVFVELQKRDNKTVLAILEMAASKPDTLISFSDVCERAGITGPKGRAAISAFTRFINSIGKTKWPFTWHDGRYKLSKEMAERWRQAEAAEAPR